MVNIGTQADTTQPIVLPKLLHKTHNILLPRKTIKKPLLIKQIVKPELVLDSPTRIQSLTNSIVSRPSLMPIKKPTVSIMPQNLLTVSKPVKKLVW